MLKKMLAISFLFQSPLAHSSSYNLVDHGTYTRDLNSNLEWLDLSFTQGLSYNALQAALINNPNLSGWRLATLPEFYAIFTSRGYVFDGTSVITKNISQQVNDPFFNTIIGYLGITQTSGNQLLSRGLLNEDYFGNEQIFGDIRYNTSTTIGSAQLGKVLDSGSGSILAAYLVRETSPSPVPAPATAWLMLSGLGVITATLRKRVKEEAKN